MNEVLLFFSFNSQVRFSLESHKPLSLEFLKWDFGFSKNVVISEEAKVDTLTHIHYLSLSCTHTHTHSHTYRREREGVNILFIK